MQPVTRYAKSGDVHVAYQVFGEGPDLVVAPGFVSHIENYWDEPHFARCVEQAWRLLSRRPVRQARDRAL